MNLYKIEFLQDRKDKESFWDIPVLIIEAVDFGEAEKKANNNQRGRKIKVITLIGRNEGFVFHATDRL